MRFDPYYKIQVWNTRAAAWVDIQQTYPTVDAAKADAPRGARVRIVEIDENGRRPCHETL